MTTRTVVEYRVLSKRAGVVKDVRYRSRKAVADRVGRLTSEEPWRFYGDALDRTKDGDDLACCSGHECGCGGATMREKAAEERKDFPPLEWVRVEQRQVTVTPWEPAAGLDSREPSPDTET